MLILNRRTHQSIKIGADVEVFILGNQNGNVVVGVKAPDEVLILRNELCHQGKHAHEK
jgi:carbon storage regulator